MSKETFKGNDIIAVVMIKNEEQIIERCLQSVYDCGIRKMMICPNGTTDKSIDVVQSFYEKHKDVKGYIEPLTWEGFGKTRTSSFEAGRKYAEFVLVLDADMCLRQKAPLRNLNEYIDGNTMKPLCGFMMEQKNGMLNYINIRIMRSDAPWTCIGRTHEAWVLPERFTYTLREWYIDDLDDGKSKGDKHERDIRLLEQDLAEKPDDGRTLFYLGNTYEVIGNSDKSLELWNKRLELKDETTEEYWFTLYHMGRCYLKLAEKARLKINAYNSQEGSDLKENKTLFEKYEGLAVTTLLKSYNLRPHRVEALLYLAEYYREHQNHALAYMFAKVCDKIPMPTKEILFVNEFMYKYGVKNNLSITSIYNKKYEEGYNACEDLLQMRNTPDTICNDTLRNRTYYIDSLGSFKSDEIAKFKYLYQLPEGFHFSTPSIVKNEKGKGFIAIVKAINYTFEEDGSKKINGDVNTIINKNYIFKLTSQFKVIGKPVEVEIPADSIKLQSNISGWDNAKLFWHKSRLFCCFSSYSFNRVVNKNINLAGMGFAEIDTKTLEVKFAREIKGLNDNIPQRDLVPINDYNRFAFVYSFEPLTLIEVDIDSGVAKLIHRNPLSICAKFWVGSSPLVRTDDNGWVCAVHETAKRKKEIISHRFVWFDKDFNLQKWSKISYFETNGLEMCNGIIPIEDNKYIISCSIEEDKGQLRTITKMPEFTQ